MTIFAHAVLGPDERPLDQIRLTGVTATGHHGVLPHEREDGQQFSADVVLHLDARPAAAADALADTVSYAVVAEDVHAVLAGSPADLIETVAERIAAVVLTHPAVVAVDVRVHKPQAPVAVPFDDVEIAIRRDRVKAPVLAAPAASAVEDAEPVEGAQPVEDAQPVEVSAPSPFVPVAPVPAPVSLPAGLPVPPPLPVGPPGPVPVPVPAHVDAPPPAAPEPAPAPEAEAASEPVPAPEAEAASEPVPAPEAEAAPELVPAPEADRLDTDPLEPVEVVLAIGANLGDAQATLRAAVTDLDRLPGIQVTEVSPLARTTPVGGPEDQPDYLNAVLLARTTLSPRALLRAAQAVENAHGRVREEHWGPRTLDIDIVRYGSLVARADDLELPHPRAHQRAFVLVPWAELQPDADLPGLGGGPVGQLAETAPDRAGIRWLALDWLAEPSVRTGSDPTAAPESAEHAPDAEAVPEADAIAAATGEPAPADATPWAEPPAAEPAAWSEPAEPPAGAEPVPPAGAEPVPHAAAEPVPWAEPAPAPVPPAPAPAVASEPAAPPPPVPPSEPPFPPVAPPPFLAEPAPAPPASPLPSIVWQPVAAGAPGESATAPASEVDDAERWIPYDPDKER